MFQSTSPHPFLLDDGTETCLVDPDGAEIISTEKLVWYGNTEWPARAGILDNGSALAALASGYRYTEQLILPGQRLYVIGELRTKSPGTERSVKNIMRELLYHWKQDKKQLHERFDTNQDGKIDQHEGRSRAQLHSLKLVSVINNSCTNRQYTMFSNQETAVDRSSSRHAHKMTCCRIVAATPLLH